MNTKRLTLLSLLLVWSLILTLPMSTSKAADLYWDDGITHVINDNTYSMYHVHLDYTVPNDPGTHLDVLSNGSVEQISGWNNSSISLYGGSVGGLGVYDSGVVSMYDGWVTGFGVNDIATATISGGSVGNLSPWDNSVLEINGGVVGGIEGWDNASVTMTSGDVLNFWMRDNVSATVSGGSIKNGLSATHNAVVTMAGGFVEDDLKVIDNAIIYLDGSGFEVSDLYGKTSSLVFGDQLSDYGTLVNGANSDYYAGTIRGNLTNGTYLDNAFEIYNMGIHEGYADIIVIPEPFTWTLFTVGLLCLSRRKRLF